MGRPKGSKNKPKVSLNDVRNVPAVGSRAKRLAKSDIVQSKKTRPMQSNAVKAPEAPRIIVNPETGHPLSERVDAYPEVTQAAIEACFKLADEYGFEEWLDDAKTVKSLPAHVELLIHAIRLARDLPCALVIKTKAENRMLIHMLAAWGRGDIGGKVTAASLQEKIDSALYWAKVNEENENTDQAAKQRARAVKFQQELDDLKGKTDA